MEGKLIAITGGASGMGLCAAKLLHSKGCKLSIADIQDPSPLVSELNALRPDSAMGRQVDISSRTQVESWIADTISHFGGQPLDGAANIAGYTGKSLNQKPIWEVEDEDFDTVMSVNVKGLLNCIRAQTQPGNFNSESGGAIVNAASVSGLVGRPRTSAYTAAKHAVVGLSKVAARDLGKRKIRVNSFAPGAIDTPMLRASAQASGRTTLMDTTPISLDRVGEPEEVANLIEFLLGPGSTYMSGECVQIDGGWYM